MNFKLFISSILLLSSFAACSLTTSATPAPSTPIVPTSASTAASSWLATATQLPPATATSPAPTLESQIAPTTAPSLKSLKEPLTSDPAHSAGVPQLFFLTGDRLMKVNADGSGKTLLSKNLFAKAAYLRAALSPRGDLLAFRAGSLPSYWGTNWDNYQPPTLNLFEVQAGTVISTVPIFSTELEQRLRANDPIMYDALYAAEQAAIAIGGDLAWSPDGRYLAFVAATDGPSSDVYSYDRETGQILRLTDGPHQAAHLLWSPDSQWIVHEEVEWFGGFDTDSGAQAIWAAAPDGSDIRKLYEVEDGRTTRLIDWLSPDTLLMRASSLDRLQLRLVDLTTGDSQLITPTTEITQIGYDHVYRWDSDAKRLWTSSAGDVVSLALDGTVKRYPDESELPFESPNGAWLLFECGGGIKRPGLRLYTHDGQLAREIASDLTSRATWSPDSTGVFYELGGVFYYVSIPDGRPQPIEENRDSPWENLGWVQP
jgi:WD40 repeat protein